MKIIAGFHAFAHGFFSDFLLFTESRLLGANVIFTFRSDIVWPLFCTFATGKTDCKSAVPSSQVSRDCTIKIN